MKRVLVFQSQHLLAGGILSLLSDKVDLHAFDATSADEITLLEVIKQVNPAVLLLGGNSHFTDHIPIFSLLNNCSHLRVIVIDELSNRIDIYERQALEVKHALDLINAIQGEE